MALFVSVVEGEVPPSHFGGKEPELRVGIVLPEDGKKEIRLVSLVPLKVGDRIVEPGADLLLGIAGDDVVVRTRDGGEKLAGRGPVVSLEPVAGAADPFSPTVRVGGVVAGRSFHWRKEIDISYPGAFEARAWDGVLLLANRVPVEPYLLGVITGEMSGECPLEFMKTQAVAARSWLLAYGDGDSHPGLPIDRCNDDHCQRYHGTDDVSDRAREAILGCRGEVLVTAQGLICDANYSKSCGGIFADPVEVWGAPKGGQHVAPDAPEGDPVAAFLPVGEDRIHGYLHGEWLRDTKAFCSPNVVCEEEIGRYLGRVDVGGHYFRWTLEVPVEELASNLAEKTGEDVARVTEFIPRRREASGRIVLLDVAYEDSEGRTKMLTLQGQYKVREALYRKFLYSSAVEAEWRLGASGEREAVVFHGAGWGHGAGLCQIGALGMAQTGHGYRSILSHYFADTKIERIYP